MIALGCVFDLILEFVETCREVAQTRLELLCDLFDSGHLVEVARLREHPRLLEHVISLLDVSLQ